MNLDHLLQDHALEGKRKNKSNSDRVKREKTIKSFDNGFAELGINPTLLQAISKLKFSEPTPVQKDAIPVGLEGGDLVALAQTGSGKTMAFGIPMLQRLSKLKNKSGLVLVPTRELAIQVDESLQILNRAVNIRSVVLIGGDSMQLQRSALKKNPRIIVATPGRLMDHIERRTVNLSNVEIFVLDEADRMLDMGFVKDIKKIMKSMPQKTQTMLFSATMPKEIEAIASKLMVDPTRIEVDRSGAIPSEVTQEVFFLKNCDKPRLLAYQLKQCRGPVLVFTKTKRMANKLTDKIKSFGFEASEIHSNKSLAQRKRALEGFKKGRYQILIATDIAARGIDVSDIEMVVNYDVPANTEDYVHRIGRTGRAGKSGHAVTYATPIQKRNIKSFERFMSLSLTITETPDLPGEKALVEEGTKLNSGKPVQREERQTGSNHPRRSSSRSFGNSRDKGKGSYRKTNSDREKSRPKRESSEFSSDRPAWKKKSFDSDDRPAWMKKKTSDSSDRPAWKNKKTSGSDDKPSWKKKKSSDSDDKTSWKKRKSSDSTRPSKAVDSKKTEQSEDGAYWSNFKKKRNPKKKSVGQGGKRRSKGKRK